MRFIYQFVTKEISCVEVDDTWGNILQDLDWKEQNRNRAETRRHSSLDTILESLEKNDSCPKQLIVPEISMEYERKLDRLKLQSTIQQLTPTQRQLLYRIFWCEETQVSIAKEKGVSASAISAQLKRCLKKLRKLL